MRLIATGFPIGNPAIAHSGTRARAQSHFTRKTFIEEMKQEQSLIVAWLQGYYLPEHEFPAIDVDVFRQHLVLA
jgi:hypothetical protein